MTEGKLGLRSPREVLKAQTRTKEMAASLTLMIFPFAVDVLRYAERRFSALDKASTMSGEVVIDFLSSPPLMHIGTAMARIIKKINATLYK